MIVNPENEGHFDLELPDDAVAPETKEVGVISEEKENSFAEQSNLESLTPSTDDFFVQDITNNSKENNDFDFDPTAFGLPADFSL